MAEMPEENPITVQFMFSTMKFSTVSYKLQVLEYVCQDFCSSS